MATAPHRRRRRQRARARLKAVTKWWFPHHARPSPSRYRPPHGAGLQPRVGRGKALIPSQRRWRLSTSEGKKTEGGVRGRGHVGRRAPRGRALRPSGKKRAAPPTPPSAPHAAYLSSRRQDSNDALRENKGAEGLYIGDVTASRRASNARMEGLKRRERGGVRRGSARAQNWGEGVRVRRGERLESWHAQMEKLR